MFMKDRVILITGANEGIGFAIAKLCRSQGANVVLHGLDVEQLRASARKLGPDVTYVGADLLEAGVSEKIIDFVVEQHGRIDGLVNNAAALDRCTIETCFNSLPLHSLQASRGFKCLPNWRESWTMSGKGPSMLIGW